jgi:hypothetical protein
MPEWKKSIFVNAVKLRYVAGEGSYEEILATYTKLTDAEKTEILETLAS